MREEELERLEAAIDKRKAEKQERENAANGSGSGSGKTDGSFLLLNLIYSGDEDL